MHEPSTCGKPSPSTNGRTTESCSWIVEAHSSLTPIQLSSTPKASKQRFHFETRVSVENVHSLTEAIRSETNGSSHGPSQLDQFGSFLPPYLNAIFSGTARAGPAKG